MILAIQSADMTTRLWLVAPGSLPTSQLSFEWLSGRMLADGILRKVMNFLAKHKLELADLTGIIVFSGPGSFTSLRIGHSVANALADSLSIPVVGEQGEDWLKLGLSQIQQAPIQRLALPHYGSEANITRPKA